MGTLLANNFNYFPQNQKITPNETLIHETIKDSKGMDGRSYISRELKDWITGFDFQLPRQFWIHQDDASAKATKLLDVDGFMRGNRIYLGSIKSDYINHILRHELVHLAQVELGLKTGNISSQKTVEDEAERISHYPIAVPVSHGAASDLIYKFWFIPIGIGLYMLIRPGIANAPGKEDIPIPSPSGAQIISEALSIFVVPGGAIGIAGKLGLGFLGKMALSGAMTNLSLRVTHDVFQGKASHPLIYLFDITTGAIIGFVVPGGIRLIGQVGTFSIDRLATYGLAKSDIALTNLLAQEAAKIPLTAAKAQQILLTRGMAGRVSQWWINRRGMMVLYRGQEIATSQILSPLGRTEGIVASEELVKRMRQLGMDYNEIAGYTARWHTQAVPNSMAPPGLGGLPLGAVGIPTTNIPGIAANFGEEGIIYIIRVPKNMAIPPLGWQGLEAENEFIILNQIPRNSIVQVIPASRVSPLMVNESGLLIPGK